MGEERAAEEGKSRPSGNAEAEQGGRVGQVEEPGGGDVGTERGAECDQEPAPGQPGRALTAQTPPGGHQEQVDADRVGPCLPPVLSGGGGQVVQVREGQGAGNDGLDQDRVDAEAVTGTHQESPG